MTLKIGIIFNLGVFFLLGAANCARANELKPIPLPPKKTIFAYQAVTNGPRIKFGSETFVLLTDLLAVRDRGKVLSTVGDLKEWGFEAAEVVETKGHFIIFRLEKPQNTRIIQSIRDHGGFSVHPVVLNPRTGRLGVVMGTLIVRFKGAMSSKTMAKVHGLSLRNESQSTRTAFFKVRMGGNPFTKAVQLQQDPTVNSVEIEVLENPVVPH